MARPVASRINVTRRVGRGATGATGATGTAGAAGAVLSGTGTLAGGGSNATSFIGIFNLGGNNTESAIQVSVNASTLTGLAAYVPSGDFTGSGSVTITVRKNGADTALTCSITTTPATNACFDGSHTVAFAAGDKLDVSVTFTGVSNRIQSGIQFSVQGH